MDFRGGIVGAISLSIFLLFSGLVLGGWFGYNSFVGLDVEGGGDIG